MRNRMKRLKSAVSSDMSPAERLRVADEIRRRVLALHPDWPTDEQRAEDFATHVRVAEALQRFELWRQRNASMTSTARG